MPVIKVMITKAKEAIEVNTDDPEQGGDLPANVYEEALALGLKALLNRGMTTGYATTGLKGEALEKVQAAALAKAKENLEKLRAGVLKRTSRSADKVPGVVMTEAMRLARAMVKDVLKAKGVKVSHVEASEITRLAKDVLAARPEIIERAKAAIAERETAQAGITLGEVQISAKKVAAAEAAKAAKKAPGEPISVKQASKPATRSKPKVVPAGIVAPTGAHGQHPTAQ